MVSSCAGLVTIESNIIRLVHYTTQEYFQRPGLKIFKDVQRDTIAISCLTYLSYDVLADGYLTEWRDEKSCLQQNSFFEYAAQNWGYHIQNIQQDIADLALKLLMDDKKVSASSRIFRVPAQFCGMHLVAYFDLNDIAVRLLQKKDPDTKDSFPLSYAAEQGNARLVELLLSYNVDINTKCNREWTLLSRL
jgi:Ankyrin repeats (many copies)